MSAITGRDPTYPNYPNFSFSNLTALINTLPPPPQELIYPDLPPPPFNPSFNPNLTASTPSYPPPTFLPIISLTPKEQALDSEGVEVPVEFRSSKDSILSQDLLKEIDELQEVHFQDYDPWNCDSSNPIHRLIAQMHNETTAKFTLFQDRGDSSREASEESTEEASAQRLKLCEQAIYEIEQLPNLDERLKRLIEVGFRRTMTIDLANYEGILLMNKFIESHQISPHIEKLHGDLMRFETRGGQYPQYHVENFWNKLLIGISYRINDSLKGRALGELLTQPLENQLKKCQELIRSELDLLPPIAPVRHEIESSLYQSFSDYQDSNLADFLKEEYINQCKLSFRLGELKPQDFDEILKILNTLYHSNVLSVFIVDVFGTLEIGRLREGIKNDANDKKREVIDREDVMQADDRVTPVRQFFRQCRFWKDSPAKQEAAKIDATLQAKLHLIDHVESRIANLRSEEEFISEFHSIPSSNPSAPLIAKTPAPPAPPAPVVVEAPPMREILTPPLPLPILLEQPVIEAAPKSNLTFSLPARKPQASYVHVAFPQLLERILPDQNPYKLFSKPVQRDLLRHLLYLRLVGPVERRIEEAFKKRVNGSTIHHVNAIYRKKLERLEKQFSGRGEKILDLYYKAQQFSPEFKDNLDAFPINDIFLKHFYSQAQAAQAKDIPAKENRYWARHHYRDSEFTHLTMQALERYLHTS